MRYFFTVIPSTVCIIGAVILAYKGIDGWGWFIFGACVVYPHTYSDCFKNK